MKKSLLPLVALLLPLWVHAVDVQVNLGNASVQVPSIGTNITFGTRNERGYYWDGREWRDPEYWKRHEGARGERYYTGRRDQEMPHPAGGHCPPGQAKKGNC